MSAFVSADPDALEAFADTASHLADRQRQVTRQLDLAIEAARRQHRALAAATGTARSIRSISTSFDHLAVEAARNAQAFRSADRVLSALGGAGGGGGGGGAWWDVDVPKPSQDWGFLWRMPGLPFAEWSRISDHFRLDFEAGVGPRIEGGVGVSVVEGVLNIGAELEAKVGAWARAAVASGLGPFVASASGELFVGASAAAEGAVQIGRNGVAAAGEAGVFVGAKAEGEVGLDIGPVGVGASGGVMVGVGAKAEGDVSFGWDRIGAKWEFGVAFGPGFEIGFEWQLEPVGIFEGIVDLGQSAWGSRAAVITADLATSAFETGAGLVIDGLDAGFDVAGGALDLAGGAFDKAGGALNKAGDAFDKAGDVLGSVPGVGGVFK